MKINEVEALVGVTRRNIRFYEKEGLLAPARNSQNGYRIWKPLFYTGCTQRGVLVFPGAGCDLFAVDYSGAVCTKGTIQGN